jgi:UDP-N-acetylmuramate--alanine ligase
MPGKHNILNALASIAVAVELGFGEENIRQGFMSFKGVKRRFTEVGQANGITIIDDYGHHPNEIAVTLKTAKEVLQGKNGSVIAVAQPHRYSRVKDLFTEFCNCFFDADKVLIADIYEAGESPLVGINKESLVEGIKKAGHKDVATLSGEDQLPIAIKQIANQGDIVVCLGAGSITNWANNLALKILDQ